MNKKKKTSFGDRKPYPFGDRGDRKPYGSGDRGDRKPYSFGDRGDKKPYASEDRGDRKPYSFGDRGDRKPYASGDRGDRKPYSFGDRGDRKPYGSGDRGDRKPYGSGDRGDRKPYGSGDRGDRKPYGSGDRGGRRPYPSGDRGDRKPYASGDRSDKKPAVQYTLSQIKEMLQLLKDSGLAEVSIEIEGLKLRTVRERSLPGASERFSISPPPPSPVSEEALEEPKTTALTINAPMIGTFYTAANPEASPFVKVGDTVEVGQTLCIIEAMKLFNEIEAEQAGVIVEVLIDNGTPVAYDQPLFRIEPT